MDYSKLAQVNVSTSVTDSREERIERRRRILDSRRCVRMHRISDNKSAIYRKFRMTDSFRNLKKQIKDALEETETTAEAIEAAIEQINEEAPAEQVVAAVTEVLAETIDLLQEQVDDTDDLDDDDLDDDDDLTDEEIDEQVEEISDSLKHEDVVVALLKNRKSGDFKWDSDGTVTHKGKKLGKVTVKDFTKKCEKIDEMVDKALDK